MKYTVTPSQAKSQLIHALTAGLVPVIHGSPAIGKSAIVRQVAEEFNLELIDVRLSQYDPTDLNGFPKIDVERGRAGYVPMETFPLEGDPLPEDKDGWLIFFDEISSAPRSVQAAAYKILLDRMVGQSRLHPKAVMAGAGNLETDNAIVEEMSTALQSRLSHLEMVPNLNDWIAQAAKDKVDYRILSFLRFKPDLLYSFKPDHTDFTYASPRTWYKASPLTKGRTDINEVMPILAGTVSSGVASEFKSFVEIHEQLPTIEQIVAAPSEISLPQEPSIQFALTGSIAAHAKESVLDGLMTFVRRLPPEFQIVCMRDMLRHHPVLVQHDAIKNWISVNAVELF
ncbi:hypothetical protein [Larsenimonas suaedae]|uniref:ATP-binding protein n=1 Tax=Larsenimonas suaedae TaxID=1851019 RepID=A0ABU1GZ00_9GAMM|nr:hypothetical protein [Larsenimonas suaedae]MCM2973754.1 hypothetical protein [Larsenimonas suaedae]MDR5897278.1 hypothetical protein [Larsenimonas suaedae]